MNNHPKITLVGCGFLGSHLAEELGKIFYSQDLGFPVYQLIDFDKWEDRNAANQHVSLEEAKKKEFKTEVCAKYLRGHPHTEVTVVNEKLTMENAHKLLLGQELVIDCLDNIPSRQILWSFAKAGVSGPAIHIGLSRTGEGMINWSSKIFDTFPFNPETLGVRDLKNQDIKEPPCQMYKYRAAGQNLIQASAKAIAFFFGKDPWEILEGTVERGTMTCWNTTSDGQSKILVDPPYLIDDQLPLWVNKNE